MKRVIANLYVVGALLLFAVCLFACAGERQGAVHRSNSP